MKKLLFIYNPRAGKAQIRSNLLDIIDTFVKAGYEVTAYPTQGPGDAVRAVRERRTGYDLLVCSGGDGTLDEVATGMMQCGERIPIGYVPAGSTNDFATSLGIPKEMTKAAAVDLIEEAADKAEKKSLGKKNAGLFSPTYTKEGLLILHEKDFFD